MNNNIASGKIPAQVGSANERSVQDLEFQLKQANEELTQFNYHVSHDLVAPISTARGLLHLMEHDLTAGITEELPELLSDAQDQLVRLDKLVSDLMLLARAGASDHHMEAFDLRPMLDDIVSTMAMHVLELEISVTLKADQPVLTSDRVRVQQILTNLISNARKFVDPEELAPEISVTCDQASTGICLRVMDNGIGIDKAIAEKLFGLFTRGTSQHAGHGLGLYIVAKHAARIGGTVTVESYSKPTMFEVLLPNVLPGSIPGVTSEVMNNNGKLHSV